MQNGLLLRLSHLNTIHIINFDIQHYGTKKTPRQNGLRQRTQIGKIHHYLMNHLTILRNLRNSILKLRQWDKFRLMRLCFRG